MVPLTAFNVSSPEIGGEADKDRADGLVLLLNAQNGATQQVHGVVVLAAEDQAVHHGIGVDVECVGPGAAVQRAIVGRVLVHEDGAVDVEGIVALLAAQRVDGGARQHRHGVVVRTAAEGGAFRAVAHERFAGKLGRVVPRTPEHDARDRGGDGEFERIVACAAVQRGGIAEVKRCARHHTHIAGHVEGVFAVAQADAEHRLAGCVHIGVVAHAAHEGVTVVLGRQRVELHGAGQEAVLVVARAAAHGAFDHLTVDDNRVVALAQIDELAGHRLVHGEALRREEAAAVQRDDIVAAEVGERGKRGIGAVLQPELVGAGQELQPRVIGVVAAHIHVGATADEGAGRLGLACC